MRSLAISAALLLGAVVPLPPARGQEGEVRDELAPPLPDTRRAPRGRAAPPPREPEARDLQEEMQTLRRRLEALERREQERREREDGARLDGPATGSRLWDYVTNNLRLSIILNTFYVRRDHAPVSADGPTGATSAFTVGQLELDLWSEHALGIDFRVDIDATEDDGQRLGGNGTFNYPEELEVEQAFVQVDLAKLLGAPPFRVAFGKFNAPFGFEPIDAPFLWQFSRSNLATFFTPNNLVGVRAGFFSQALDVEGYLVNGWNVNDDPDREKTGGGRLTLKLGGEPGAPLLSLAPAVIFGHEETSVRAGSRRVVADVVLVVRPIERLALALEGNFGHESDPVERGFIAGGPPITAGDHSTWDAYQASLNIRFTGWLALTLRGEYLRDRQGYQTLAVRRLGRVEPHYLKSGTVALLFKIPTGGGEVFEPLFINLEWRYDRSNHRLYTSRSPSNAGDETHASQLAFQVIFHF